jgi:hypothetical protein
MQVKDLWGNTKLKPNRPLFGGLDVGAMHVSPVRFLLPVRPFGIIIFKADWHKCVFGRFRWAISTDCQTQD